MNSKISILIVYGTDTEQKPHAARFSESDAETAAKAAQLMGFKIGKAVSDDAIALAKDLPEGKVFATGKALVPYVKPEVYEKLVSLAEAATVGDSNKAKTQPSPEVAAAPKLATDLWSEIKVGSLVIARSPFKDDNGGWWEAVVLSMSKDGDQLTVRWTEFPDEPKFNVRRRAVAMRLPTTAKPSAKPAAETKPASPKG